MTIKKQTAAIRADESVEDDVFREIMHQFVLATERLTLACHALTRCEDYGPATCVVEEVTEALVQIRRDLEGWDTGRIHTAKEVQS